MRRRHRQHYQSAKYNGNAHNDKSGFYCLPQQGMKINTEAFCSDLGAFATVLSPSCLTFIQVPPSAGTFPHGACDLY